jgi:hypothetical protein
MNDMTENDEREDIIIKPWYPSSSRRSSMYVFNPKQNPPSRMGLQVFTPDETPQKGGKITEM